MKQHRPDRVCRREFLKVGAVLGGSFALSDLLRLRSLSAERGIPQRQTSVIFVTLGGGPSQFETYDPKPAAPAEYRGEFQPIATRHAGFHFCELLPRQAAIADRLAIVRTVSHQQASHIAEHIVETGYDLQNSANARKGEMPSVGSVISKIRGVGNGGIPGYVSIPRHHAYAGAHWLGAQHNYFAVNDDPNADGFKVSNLSVGDRLTLDRVRTRRALLTRLDAGAALHDLDGAADSLDAFSRQALDLVSGETAQRAFDVALEPSRVRERYGRNTLGQRLLLARRLVEIAAVPFVTVRMGGWDDHDQLPQKIRKRAPEFDLAITALIDDLQERGMSRDVLVVAMGEFGRTPRINGKAGRDHWPAVNSVMLAGGRFRMGQVIGETDARGGRVLATPYRPQSVLEMVYRHLGIDSSLTFADYSGRPRYVLEERTPIRELL